MGDTALCSSATLVDCERLSSTPREFFVLNAAYLCQKIDMKFTSLQPFVPSGADFQKSKQFFLELGFNLAWDAGDYAGLEKDGCRFVLQKFDNKPFAENFMLTVRVDDVDQFRNGVI